MSSLRAAIYTRVSTTDQGTDDKGSLENQETRCRKLCEAKGYAQPTVDDVFRETRSGMDSERPEYRRMIEAAKDGAYDVVVALDTDRLARDFRSLMKVIYDELNPAGVAVAVVNGGVDTSSDEGQFVLNMFALFGDYDRKKILKRTTAGKKHASSQGKYWGGQAPLGYAFGDDAGVLVVVESEARVVRTIFRLSDEGVSAGHIAGMLNQDGEVTKKGKPWRQAHVLAALNLAPLYRGDGKDNGKAGGKLQAPAILE